MVVLVAIVHQVPHDVGLVDVCTSSSPYFLERLYANGQSSFVCLCHDQFLFGFTSVPLIAMSWTMGI